RLAESDDHRYPRVVEAGPHGRVDDSEPVSGLHPRRRGAFTHFIDQDFGRGAGRAIQSGILQLAENIPRIAAGQLLQTENLLGAECIDVDFRIARFERPQQIQIPLKWQVGIDAALKQNIATPDSPELVHLSRDFIERESEGALLAFGTIERAKSA